MPRGEEVGRMAIGGAAGGAEGEERENKTTPGKTRGYDREKERN